MRASSPLCTWNVSSSPSGRAGPCRAGPGRVVPCRAWPCRAVPGLAGPGSLGTKNERFLKSPHTRIATLWPAWPGLAWPGLAWPGRAGRGLACTGLVKKGLLCFERRPYKNRDFLAGLACITSWFPISHLGFLYHILVPCNTSWFPILHLGFLYYILVSCITSWSPPPSPPPPLSLPLLPLSSRAVPCLAVSGLASPGLGSPCPGLPWPVPGVAWHGLGRPGRKRSVFGKAPIQESRRFLSGRQMVNAGQGLLGDWHGHWE